MINITSSSVADEPAAFPTRHWGFCSRSPRTEQRSRNNASAVSYSCMCYSTRYMRMAKTLNATAHRSSACEEAIASAGPGGSGGHWVLPLSDFDRQPMRCESSTSYNRRCVKHTGFPESAESGSNGTAGRHSSRVPQPVLSRLSQGGSITIVV